MNANQHAVLEGVGLFRNGIYFVNRINNIFVLN